MSKKNKSLELADDLLNEINSGSSSPFETPSIVNKPELVKPAESVPVVQKTEPQKPQPEKPVTPEPEPEKPEIEKGLGEREVVTRTKLDELFKNSHRSVTGGGNLTTQLDAVTMERMGMIVTILNSFDLRKSNRLAIAAAVDFLWEHHGVEIEKRYDKFTREKKNRVKL